MIAWSVAGILVVGGPAVALHLFSIALTKALAIDYAPDGIRVNCILPAGVQTPLLQQWINQQRPLRNGANRQGYAAKDMARQLVGGKRLAAFQ